MRHRSSTLRISGVEACLGPEAMRKPNAIRVSGGTRKWLWANEGSYVVVRRFTSKEERRRIIAAIYGSDLPGELVGFENHLNVFHVRREGMPGNLAGGLALFLNCSLVDRYFRQFNGHTQVNATDLRRLRYPDRATLERLRRTARCPYAIAAGNRHDHRRGDRTHGTR